MPSGLYHAGASQGAWYAAAAVECCGEVSNLLRRWPASRRLIAGPYVAGLRRPVAPAAKVPSLRLSRLQHSDTAQAKVVRPGCVQRRFRFTARDVPCCFSPDRLRALRLVSIRDAQRTLCYRVAFSWKRRAWESNPASEAYEALVSTGSPAMENAHAFGSQPSKALSSRP